MCDAHCSLNTVYTGAAFSTSGGSGDSTWGVWASNSSFPLALCLLAADLVEMTVSFLCVTHGRTLGNSVFIVAGQSLGVPGTQERRTVLAPRKQRSASFKVIVVKLSVLGKAKYTNSFQEITHIRLRKVLWESTRVTLTDP